MLCDREAGPYGRGVGSDRALHNEPSVSISFERRCRRCRAGRPFDATGPVIEVRNRGAGIAAGNIEHDYRRIIASQHSRYC